MVTFGIDNPGIKDGGSYLAFAVKELPEGATQTFEVMAPVVITAGFAVIGAVPPTGGWEFFALRAGQNNAVAGAVRSEVIPLVTGLQFYANFLAAGGGTNAYAATDMGSNFRYDRAAVLPPGSTNVWYVADSGTNATVRLLGDLGDQSAPNSVNANKAVVGDNNIRGVFEVLDAARITGT